MIRVKFKEWDCKLHLGRYGNDVVALWLNEIGTGEPIATATVNLDGVVDIDEDLEDHFVYIKEWSEGEGMTQALIDAGVIRHDGNKQVVGPYGSFANVCEIIHEDLLKQIYKDD